MLPLFMDQLDSARRKVFLKLKAFSKQFVLAGGTAIMLQIGHRKSLDFDCFSEKEPSPYLLSKIKKGGISFRLQLKTAEIVAIKTTKGIDISFVWHPYKPLQPLIETASISLFHLDDLVANKAYTIGRRGAWRDYVDLFFFLKWRLYSIQDIIKLTNKKFSGEFNEKLFLGQLCYFDDLKIVPTTFLKELYTDEQIKSFLEDEVRSHLKKVRNLS